MITTRFATTAETKDLAAAAKALFDAAENLHRSMKLPPGGKDGGALDFAFQALIAEASRRRLNDGRLVEAHSHACAATLSQTSDPHAAFVHHQHLTARLTHALMQNNTPSQGTS